jgi:hypothetical protein
MEKEEHTVKRVSDNYFKFIVFLSRIAGIPLKMNNIPTIYAIYMLTVIFCCCSTIIGFVVDVYEHRDNLGHIMTSMRVLMPLINDMFICVYCR